MYRIYQSAKREKGYYWIGTNRMPLPDEKEFVHLNFIDSLVTISSGYYSEVWNIDDFLNRFWHIEPA